MLSKCFHWCALFRTPTWQCANAHVAALELALIQLRKHHGLGGGTAAKSTNGVPLNVAKSM